jgi:lysyl-tRNA synthetase class 2
MTDIQNEEALSTDASEVRLQKRARLEELVGNLFPTDFHRTITNGDLMEKYADIEDDFKTGDIVTVAGRIYSSRNNGMFMDMGDANGKVQIFTHKNNASEEVRERLQHIDIGDIIGVTGEVRRTPRGELTVNATDITMLCKTLRPMPEKYHGLTDVETRYRKRYLDFQ